MRSGIRKSDNMNSAWISFCESHDLKDKSQQKPDRHTLATLTQFIQDEIKKCKAVAHEDYNAVLVLHALKNSLIDVGYVDVSFRKAETPNEDSGGGGDSKDHSKGEKRDKKDKKEKKDKKDKKDKKRSKESMEAEDDKDGKRRKTDMEKAAVPKSASYSVSNVFDTDGGAPGYPGGKGGKW